jgi:hypothetical protein
MGRGSEDRQARNWPKKKGVLFFLKQEERGSGSKEKGTSHLTSINFHGRPTIPFCLQNHFFTSQLLKLFGFALYAILMVRHVNHDEKVKKIRLI